MKKVRPFLSGILVGVLLTACITGAVAVGGSLREGNTAVVVNGSVLLAAGSTVQGNNGAPIPSTVLYTDALGGITHYVPVRAFSEALGMDVVWNSGTKAVEITAAGDAATAVLPLNLPGVQYGNAFEEIAPITDRDGQRLQTIPSHIGTALNTYLQVDQEKGDTISITVTNRGTAPIQWSLGVESADQSFGVTRVPAGTTVTRTLKSIMPKGKELPQISINVGNAAEITREINLSMTIDQFT